MADQTPAQSRRATLVLEIELPAFYAENIHPDDPDWQEWLKMVDVDPSDAEAVGRELLGNIGEVNNGLLTIEVAGEKDSEIYRVPVLMRGARVEDRPPTPEDQWRESVDWLRERADEGGSSDA